MFSIWTARMKTGTMLRRTGVDLQLGFPDYLASLIITRSLRVVSLFSKLAAKILTFKTIRIWLTPQL
jgi:hypothetical protein